MLQRPGFTALGLMLGLVSSASSAQTIERILPGDIFLGCPAIAQEIKQLEDTVAAGDPSTPSMGKAAAGTAANAGGQLAGAVAAQSMGIFGGLGGILSKAAGTVAQQQVEERMAPSPEAQRRAAEAKQRQEFLIQLATAKECRNGDPEYTGKLLTQEQFTALTSPQAPLATQPLNAAAVAAMPNETIGTLAAQPRLEGDLKLAGKRIYISEFRVLFEVGGKVSASTRSGYLAGTSYGATHSTINYTVASLDIDALQALTDRAWVDFKARLAEKGVRIEDREAFVGQFGEVYPATEDATSPGKPVYIEANQGYVARKYLVMAPKGMKLHPRSLAGMGAGNISKRIEYVKNKLDGLAIGVAVNIANLESSGSGSSILHRDGSSTAAREGMTITGPAGAFVANGHAEGAMLRMPEGFDVPGTFARFREVGGYDTQKDAVAKSMQIVSALAGVAASKSKTVDMEVDLDAQATSRLVMQGLATFNAAMVNKIQMGL